MSDLMLNAIPSDLFGCREVTGFRCTRLQYPKNSFGEEANDSRARTFGKKSKLILPVSVLHPFIAVEVCQSNFWIFGTANWEQSPYVSAGCLSTEVYRTQDKILLETFREKLLHLRLPYRSLSSFNSIPLVGH